ncbi:MAG: aldo/keto reductase [Bacillota bacterium]|nr:aldo/keto reductase [Bacillota bacterium]
MFSKSKLGFGLMRLPKNEEGRILVEQVEKMVDAFLEKGFTYFDTAYAYAGSENAIREALVKRYPRERFTLADKMPAWKIEKEEDVERIFNESLEACGVEYFDFYLVHSIEEGNYALYQKYKVFEFVKKMKQEGKIKHLGFSFHDSPEMLERVLNEHPEMEFVQLQLNYLDWENAVIQSRKNYEVARSHNLPIVVMEPVKGGRLASFNEDIEAIYKTYDSQKSIASWALRFIASQKGIMTILSGMSNQEQMEDNLETMANFVPLNEEEKELVSKVREKLLSQPTIQCTQCRYCTPGCPMNISIPDLFTAYNSQKLYGKSGRYKTYYEKFTKDGNLASTCIKCGQCESVCPQHLEIISSLEKVASEFE